MKIICRIPANSEAKKCLVQKWSLTELPGIERGKGTTNAERLQQNKKRKNLNPSKDNVQSVLIKALGANF